MFVHPVEHTSYVVSMLYIHGLQRKVPMQITNALQMCYNTCEGHLVDRWMEFYINFAKQNV